MNEHKDLIDLLTIAVNPDIETRQSVINKLYRLNIDGVYVSSLSKGSTVVKAGANLNCVHILVRGACCISKTASDGRTVLSATYEGKTVFGLCEHLCGSVQFDDTVVATGQSCVMSISIPLFAECMNSSPVLQNALMKSLAMYVRSTIAHSDRLSTHNNSENLLLYLNEKCKDGTFPKIITVGKKQIAEELNMNLRTLYRQLDALVDQGFIGRNQGKIVISEHQYIKMKRSIDNMFEG